MDAFKYFVLGCQVVGITFSPKEPVPASLNVRYMYETFYEFFKLSVSDIDQAMYSSKTLFEL